MARLIAKDWGDFQHYKDRSPAWIKLHKKLIDDYEFQCLPVASRALAPMLWLLASEENDGSIDYNPAKIAFRLRTTKEEVVDAVKPLIDAGFFRIEGVLEQDASAVLAECLPREREEREIEKEREIEPVATKHGKTATATRLPADWVPSDADQDFCRTERPLLDPMRVADSFRDYWIAQPGAKGRKLDWSATWRNWVRNEKQPQPNRQSFQSIHDQRAATIAELTGCMSQNVPMVGSGNVIEGECHAS